MFQLFQRPTCPLLRDSSDFKYSKLTVERPLLDEATGEPILKKGKPQPDSKKRDTEIVPWTEDIDEYMQKNVLPYAPDAWIERRKLRLVMRYRLLVSFINM